MSNQKKWMQELFRNRHNIWPEKKKVKVMLLNLEK